MIGTRLLECIVRKLYASMPATLGSRGAPCVAFAAYLCFGETAFFSLGSLFGDTGGSLLYIVRTTSTSDFVSHLILLSLGNALPARSRSGGARRISHPAP